MLTVHKQLRIRPPMFRRTMNSVHLFVHPLNPQVFLGNKADQTMMTTGNGKGHAEIRSVQSYISIRNKLILLKDQSRKLAMEFTLWEWASKVTQDSDFTVFTRQTQANRCSHLTYYQ